MQGRDGRLQAIQLERDVPVKWRDSIAGSYDGEVGGEGEGEGIDRWDVSYAHYKHTR